MKRPVDIVRKDGTNHHPIWDEERERCHLFGCDGFSYVRRVWRYQRGNQNLYMEEEQTTHWPKEKVQTMTYKTYI